MACVWKRICCDVFAEKEEESVRPTSKLTFTSDVFNSMTSFSHSVLLLLPFVDEDLLRNPKKNVLLSFTSKLTFFLRRIYIKYYYCLFRLSTIIHSNNAFIIIKFDSTFSLAFLLRKWKRLDSHNNSLLIPSFRTRRRRLWP